MREKLCKAEADQLRREVGSNVPPFDVIEMAGSLFLTAIPKSPWKWRSRSLLRRENGEIWINAEETEHGKRFSVGHEIGHFLLHADALVFSAHAEETSHDYAADPEKELEKEADYFSSVLLVPPTLLRKDVDQGMMPDDLVKRYDVSREVIFIALEQHHLLSRVGARRRR